MRVIELHAPCKVVQRSKGRSAVAAAAYRAGERLTDERTGLVHDYTRKKGIEGQALILPDNAPAYAHDREKLWNAAEKIEKHPRAQTARDLTVAFPSEFSADQRAEAGHRVGQWLMFRYGCAVDLALHEPSRKGDQEAQYRNYHAHLLFTTRRWDENGKWAKTKDRTLDDLQKGPDEIRAMRLAVADVMNNIAARDRLDIYVEHLSYAERGLDREPTQHLGPMATQIERQGRPSEIGDKNREIQERNRQREQLERESNVIDIETARELMRQKGKAPSLPPAQRAAYTAFYRDTQNRRAAMLEALERENGQKERELRQESAQLNQSLTGANWFMRTLRWISGQTRQEKEQLAQVTADLEMIRQRKEATQLAFEADRRTRMEAMVQQRQQQEQQARALLYAKAVGEDRSPAPPGSDYDARRAGFMAGRRAAPPEAQGPGIAAIAPPAPAPVKTADAIPAVRTRPDYVARRDAFLAGRRIASAEVQKRSEATTPPVPPPVKTDAIPPVKPRPDYEARRDAFFAGRRRRGAPEAPKIDATPAAKQPAPAKRVPARRLSEDKRSPQVQETAIEGAPARPQDEGRREQFMERMRKGRRPEVKPEPSQDEGPSLDR